MLSHTAMALCGGTVHGNITYMNTHTHTQNTMQKYEEVKTLFLPDVEPLLSDIFPAATSVLYLPQTRPINT